MPTSNVRTNTGSVGATSPKPMAIMNEAPTRTQMGRGSRSGRTPAAGEPVSTTRTPPVRAIATEQHTTRCRGGPRPTG